MVPFIQPRYSIVPLPFSRLNSTSTLRPIRAFPGENQVRYRCPLLYRRLTSPMINGEIPMSSIIQTVDFADDQRRDTDVFYYTDGWLRR